MKRGHLAIICGVIDVDDPVGEQSIALADELCELGYTVSLLALATNETDLDPRINVIEAGPMPRRPWTGMAPYPRWVKKTLDEISPDHTVSMLSTVPASIAVPVTGTLRARRRATRNLSNGVIGALALQLGQLRPESLVMGWLERRAMADASVENRIALPPLIRQALEEDTQASCPPIESAHLSAVLQPIEPAYAAQVREQLSRAFGIHLDSYRIVLPFADARLDGFETMLRAFAPLIKQGVDATLLLAGPTRYTHLAWIGELGLRDRVRLLGETPRREVLFAAADLVVNPTRYEPLGQAVRQSIAAGTPVITTTASGAAEAARDGIDTVLPAQTEPEALLQAVREHYQRWQQREPEPARNAPQSSSAPTLSRVIDRIIRDRAS